jgi:phospholipid N-methyltransferase
MQSSTHQKYPTRTEQMLYFLRAYMKHPRMLGAMTPSSRFVVGEVLRKVDWEHAKVIVEYGPGVGTFTTEILKRMRADATLIAFELNNDFVRFLRQRYPDPRFHVVQGSAALVDSALAQLGHLGVDYVISGIPFSTMPAPERDAIISKTHKLLNPDGAFLVYQVSGAVGPHLQRVFSNVHRAYEPLNILPARLFYCMP